ncbi:hypothetical protein V0R50_04560 [Pseudomonas sp. 148P]|uniref:Uncharacterized protein n=1 Tax=Pseudomonas ulcerans TaxID=3115852 RepID=A0ABU7HLR8_9PSED|nr:MULTISPECIES: hypothetical protein [unclassified Pseudomonas]MEE1921168.1 hypothetical protein [Pseudomonas sp. 147P]MEE1932483.1 hypothetical protein [Pseudomonas sp. 148P]
MQIVTSFEGLQQPHSQGTAAATQSRIHCVYWLSEFYMLDVAPWGIILPLDVIGEGLVSFSLEIASLGLPAGTVLGMRWTPESGNDTHLETYHMTGDEPANVRLRLKSPWLWEAEGQRVLIEHEIVQPDGSVTIGEPVTVQVANELVFGKMTVDGLREGSVLDPKDYPDGIRVHYTPIDNIRDYQRVSFLWSALGIREGMQYTLANIVFSSPGKPGEDYYFRVPQEYYTGLDDTRFERVIFQASASVKLAPEPNPQFFYGYGGFEATLLQNTQHG